MDTETFKKEEKRIETKDCCVCINVYTKCDQSNPGSICKEIIKTDKKEDKCCVCINVYTECV